MHFFRCESAILSENLDFFLKFIQIQNETVWIKIDAEGRWKWIPVRAKKNTLNFYHLWNGVSDGLVTHSACCKGSVPPASACSDSIRATSENSSFLTGMEFYFFLNYLNDSCPNLVHLAAETDLDEIQHLVPFSSLSQSPSPMGWKVICNKYAVHWIHFSPQMLGRISHDIMDFGYDHKNAGITRTRLDQKPACSSFPSPNALETAENFTGITHAAMYPQGKLICASLHHL